MNHLKRRQEQIAGARKTAPANCPCSFLTICLLVAVCFVGSSTAFSQSPPGPSSPLYGARPEYGNPATGLPAALKEVRIEQKLNQQLPLDLIFRDEAGQQVKLGQYFGKKPVVLAFVYYDCPNALHTGAQRDGHLVSRTAFSDR